MSDWRKEFEAFMRKRAPPQTMYEAKRRRRKYPSYEDVDEDELDLDFGYLDLDDDDDADDILYTRARARGVGRRQAAAAPRRQRRRRGVKYADDAYTPRHMRPVAPINEWEPSATRRAAAECTPPDRDHENFGCGGMARPVPNGKNSYCCVPIDERERAALAATIESYVTAASRDDTVISLGDTEREILYLDIVLASMKQLYPADFASFSIGLDRGGNLIVKYVGDQRRHARLFESFGGCAGGGDSCKYSEPKPTGKGVGGCPVNRDFHFLDLVPKQRSDGLVCCQKITPAQRKEIVDNFYASIDAMHRADNYMPGENVLVDRIFDTVAKWTVSPYHKRPNSRGFA